MSQTKKDDKKKLTDAEIKKIKAVKDKVVSSNQTIKK
jgi:hypothetical protein